MKRNVKCPFCGEAQITYGKDFFRCKSPACKRGSVIKDNLINPLDRESTPIKKVEIEEPYKTPLAKSETVAITEEKEMESLKTTPNPSPKKNLLEIEDAEENEEEIKEEIKNSTFKCPECDAPVKEYSDCENCGAEIIWQE